MSTMKEMTCKLCPVQCKLSVEYAESKNGKDHLVKNVYGIRCNRGVEYIMNESFEPRCMLPATVRMKGHYKKRLPVNTDGLIPQNKVQEALMIINQVEVVPPIKTGEIIVQNILDTGVNIIAKTRIDGRDSK